MVVLKIWMLTFTPPRSSCIRHKNDILPCMFPGWRCSDWCTMPLDHEIFLNFRCPSHCQNVVFILHLTKYFPFKNCFVLNTLKKKQKMPWKCNAKFDRNTFCFGTHIFTWVWVRMVHGLVVEVLQLGQNTTNMHVPQLVSQLPSTLHLLQSADCGIKCQIWTCHYLAFLLQHRHGERALQLGIPFDYSAQASQSQDLKLRIPKVETHWRKIGRSLWLVWWCFCRGVCVVVFLCGGVFVVVPWCWSLHCHLQLAAQWATLGL